MRVLVTGSAGFLGRTVVRQLLQRGHEVVALVRPMSDASRFADSERVRLIRHDLRQKGGLGEQLDSVDAAIHLAAATGGDLPEQFANSVVATENLLDALPRGGVRRFVHVSSFSVYDFAARRPGSLLDEAAALEQHPEERDAYTWTKLYQEELVRRFCEEEGLSFAVIRPGAIYGPGKEWAFGSAMTIGRVDLVFSPFAQFRLTHVDNCADAIVLAAESPAADGETFNVVDDGLPSHAGYRRICRRAGADLGPAVYVPWLLVAACGWLVRSVNRVFFGNRARLPEILAYRRQQARWKPFRYSNRHLKEKLGWEPTVSIEDGVRELVGARQPPHLGDRTRQIEAAPAKRS